MRKRSLLFLFAILAAICALCFAACGSNGNGGTGGGEKTSGEYTEVAEIEYELSVDETYYIVKGVKTKTCTEAVIPSTHNEKPVGEIGVGAFSYCRSLTSITIPDSVKIIRDDAFSYCDSLTGVYITDMAAWCNIKFNYYYSNPLYYAHNLYLNNELVTDLVVPDNVRSIGYAVFSGCRSLTSVTIGAGETRVGEIAFYKCTSLTSVTIGSNMPFIQNEAFKSCYKLVEVINKSKREIVKGGSDFGGVGYYALTIHRGESKIVNKDGYLFITDNGINYLLGYKENATELNLPENYNNKEYEIYQYAFYECTSLTRVTIPDGVTSIGEDTFGGCSSLTSVTIGNDVASIGDWVFSGCSSLTSITIPDSVTSIGDNAFNGCDKLIKTVKGVSYVDKWVVDCDTSVAKVELKDDTAGIAYKAFDNCKLLRSATIPDSVTSIGEDAFYQCTSLTSIIIPDSVTSIGDNAINSERDLRKTQQKTPNNIENSLQMIA